MNKTYQFYRGWQHNLMRGLFPLFLLGIAAFGFMDDDGFCFGVGAALFALLSLVALSFNYVAVIDSRYQQVRRTRTLFWGVPDNERLFVFSDFTHVEVCQDDAVYQLRLRCGWRCYELTSGGEICSKRGGL